MILKVIGIGVVWFVASFCCGGQAQTVSEDLFPIRQITNDFAQQGFPGWSPDGKFIVFASNDREDTAGKNGLWKLSLETMEREKVLSGVAEHPRWSPDNRYIVFDADTGNSIKMIPVAGGEQIEFLNPSIQIRHGGLPCWSPDGSKLMFFEGSKMIVWVYDLNTKEFTRIFQNPDKIPMPGCWSKDGKSVLLAVREKESYQSTIWRVDIDGEKRIQIKGHGDTFYRYLELSPDGTLLAFVRVQMEERTSSIWVMPADGGEAIQLVAPNGFNESPNWSPDGSKLAFTSTRANHFDIWMADIDMVQLKKKLRVRD